MILLSAREVPLDPRPEYEVVFSSRLLHDLAGEDNMDELTLEAEATLALRFDDIPGKRISKVTDSKNPELYKFRPHAASNSRFIFAHEEDEKRRIVLDFWPRKRDYRKHDLKTASKRFKAFLEGHRSKA